MFELYMNTNPNQFGFKRKHDTDQCIYVLKEIIGLYRILNGSVFVCFLNTIKAFDRVIGCKGRSRIHIANTNLLV